MKKFLFLVAFAPMVAMATEPVDTLRPKELQGVQVVSTRASRKTPVAYSDMTRQQIERVNHGKDVPLLLQMQPSVTVSSDAGMGIGYTGIRVRGTDPTRINVTTNGIPMNDGESSQLYWVNLGDLISSVQSVQLQRGVGTSTNGAGAFGATLNMLTENIGLQPYATVNLSAGSYGTHKESLRFSTGLLGGHWGLQGRVSNIGSDGYISRASTRLNSYFLQAGYFGKNTVLKLITFNGTEKTYHAWDYASRADMERYGRRYNPSGAYTDADGNTAYSKNQTDNYHQQNYQLLWNQWLCRNFTLNAALHYTHGDGYYEQYKTDQKLYKYWMSEGKKVYSDLIRQKCMDNDFYGAVAALNFDNHRNLTFNIGGGWNKYVGDHYGEVVWVRTPDATFAPINPNQRYYDNTARKTDGNVYAKATWDMGDGMSGYLDLQYRHVDYKSHGSSQEFEGVGQQVPLVWDKKYNFLNPKVGLIYRLGQHHTFYMSGAVAHKEPTRNDMEDMLAESNGIDPKAERLEDAELGYKFESNRFTFNANFYRMNYDNQFVLTGAQDSNGEMVARNIKDSYRMGVELTAAWRPVKNFAWEANATWSRNRARHMQLTVLDTETWEESVADVGSTHLAYSPDFIAANTFSYEWHGFRASLMSKYVGKQYMTNSNFKSYVDEDNNGRVESAMLDAFFTTDLDLNYTFSLRGLKQLTVGCTVYNLFGEKYESNGSCGLNFKRAADGSIQAFNNHNLGFWTWSTYSAQAPTHFLAYLSISL